MGETGYNESIMNFALGYLVERAFYRLGDFFHHWYVDGSRSVADSFISTLESLDQTFAVVITLHHFFEPLYGDWSVIGRILGVVFRSARIAIGSVVYMIVALFFLAGYLVFLAIPLLTIAYVAAHLI
jgi:hypothetical protein